MWSGVALLYRPGGAAHGAATAKPQELVFAEETVVTFAALPAAAIESYVDSGEPMDKAGCATRTLAQPSHLAFWRPGAWRLSRLASVRGYGIQAAGGQFVSRIDGCFYNVMVSWNDLSSRRAAFSRRLWSLCCRDSRCIASQRGWRSLSRRATSCPPRDLMHAP